jgi:hypothetical protein
MLWKVLTCEAVVGADLCNGRRVEETHKGKSKVGNNSEHPENPFAKSRKSSRRKSNRKKEARKFFNKQKMERS